MQIMNAIKTTCQIESSIAHFVRRGAMLIALLLAFVAGVRAEVEYVIYYDVVANNSTIRHYVSISEDGNSVVDATTFSEHCVWVADAELEKAQGEWGVRLTGDANTANTSNRKSFQSKKHRDKYLSGPSSGYESSSQNPPGLAPEARSVALWKGYHSFPAGDHRCHRSLSAEYADHGILPSEDWHAFFLFQLQP